MPQPDPQDAHPSPPPASPARGARRLAPTIRWVGIGVLVYLVGAAWAVAMPLMAGPDEPSHVIWAAAVARGQLDGDLGAGAADASRPGAGTMVDLPTDYGAAAALPNCIAFHPESDASCQQDVAPPTPGALVDTETFAGQYPPLYYAVVGWPSLLMDAEAATYGMRLVSAAVVAALVTAGVWLLVRTFGRGRATWATAVAVTPMCLFLAGTVNPQALEISAAFAFWASCLALARGPSPAPTSTYVHAAVSGALLVNARATSPVWAVVVVVVALLLAPRGRWREVLRHRAARWVGVVAGVAAVAAAGWIATHPVVVDGAQLHPDLANPLRAAAGAVSHSYEYLVGMIGLFGWLDTPSPPLTITTWFVVGSMLVLVALVAPLASAARRQRWALVLLGGAVLGAPVVLQVPTAPQTGLIWQGRYALPIAVGLPIVAVALLRDGDATTTELVRRLGRVVVPVLALAHVGAFLWAARRFSEGTDGDVLTLAPEWSSPIGYLPGVVLYASVVATLAWLAWRALRPEPDDPHATTDDAGRAVPQDVRT